MAYPPLGPDGKRRDRAQPAYKCPLETLAAHGYEARLTGSLPATSLSNPSTGPKRLDPACSATCGAFKATRPPGSAGRLSHMNWPQAWFCAANRSCATCWFRWKTRRWSWPDHPAPAWISQPAPGLPAAGTMTSDTLTSSREPCRQSTTRSEQKCNPSSPLHSVTHVARPEKGSDTRIAWQGQ